MLKNLKRLRLMGSVFILLALGFCVLAYTYIPTRQQQEGAYMIASVFFLMAIFCLRAYRQKRIFLSTYINKNRDG